MKLMKNIKTTFCKITLLNLKKGNLEKMKNFVYNILKKIQNQKKFKVF